MPQYKTVCLIYVALAGLNAFSFLFFPQFSIDVMQRTTSEFGIFAMQMAGGCALGLALIAWLSRTSTDPHLQEIVLIGNLAVMLALIYADLMAFRSGAFSWVGGTFLAGDITMAILFSVLLIQIRNSKTIIHR